MSSHVEQIKDRLGIVEIISSYVKLEKAGVNFKAKCPFHNEKTPSFVVSPARNTYYCFGCGAKGDIFSFVEQFEGTDFKGALRTLADRAGVELTPTNKETVDQRARLYNVLEEATSFFEKNLTIHPEARKYVTDRGISKKSISTWRIGYASPEWRGLKDSLIKKGYTEKELLESGLIKKPEKGGDTYDRFRGRVMFPIMDTSGRVIAYSGRILPDKKKLEYKEDTAKYLNSPETTLYQKSRVLYGFHSAKNTVRKYDFSIIVEGQMDVVLSHQSGYTNTVAVSGTALTNEQISLLARLSNNLVVAFDSDAAGMVAGSRGIDLALARGMDVKVVEMPSGKDPADLVLDGAESWKKAVRESKHVIDFHLDYLSNTHDDLRKLRLAVSKVVIPYITYIPDRIDQAHFVANIASRLGIAESPIWEAVRNNNQSREQGDLNYSLRATSQEEAETVSRREVIENRLLGILLWQESNQETPQVIDTKEMRASLEVLIGKGRLEEGIKSITQKGDGIIFEIEQLYVDNGDLDEEISDLCIELNKEYLREEYDKAFSALKNAESKGFPNERIKELEGELAKVAARIK